MSGLMSRESRFAPEFCRLCAEVCDACGMECGRHDHDHCQRCADACAAKALLAINATTTWWMKRRLEPGLHTNFAMNRLRQFHARAPMRRV